MSQTTDIQTAARMALGAMLLTTGTGHLTFARRGFRAQVPHLATQVTPLSEDDVVADSGYAELALGAATILAPSTLRPAMGWVLAGTFAAIFPGNIAQYLNRRDGLGLNTDRARFLRLFGQPVLIAWALWSTGAWDSLRSRLAPKPAEEAAKE